MAVTKYEKDGKTFWRVYLDLRGRKNARVRVQKRVNHIESELEAIAEEKKLLRELSVEVTRLESLGLRWEEVIDRWARYQELYPTKRLAATTIMDYEALLKNWTRSWLNRKASELNRGDARALFRQIENDGKNANFRKHLKNTIHQIYIWGIEERHITGVFQSPVHGMDIDPDREEKKPEILSSEQIRVLLKKAQEQKHPWYCVWVAAIFTGCRSGELHELLRNDVQIISREQAQEEDKKPFNKRHYGFIHIKKSWNTRLKKPGPTKAGHWRTVPISSEFYWFLINDLQIESISASDPLFPRFCDWDRGAQAKVLKAFCISNRLQPIKFHTLRACFATQLISTGIPATTVMKICGWRDLKTMQRYIRLAGIDESGATELLHFIPTAEATMETAAIMYAQPKGGEIMG